VVAICNNGVMPSVLAGIDASHAQVVGHICTLVVRCVHVAHGVSLGPSVDSAHVYQGVYTVMLPFWGA